ncbi:hypothetical protein DL93DRAFT_2080179 [Clavulina sp. PMI_390]|nr:hypothetical protein DL93DRAFT_2080179 [Clavulina sp. PMI_390]
MRASIIIAATLAVVASATPFDLSRRDYPSKLLFFLSPDASFTDSHLSPVTACADSCLANANLDGCGATDYSCLCQDHTFLDTTTQCIYNACTDPTDLQQAVATASAVCAAAVRASSALSPDGER